jgi:energy-converting hydrogenase Eha subunit F
LPILLLDYALSEAVNYGKAYQKGYLKAPRRFARIFSLYLALTVSLCLEKNNIGSKQNDCQPKKTPPKAPENYYFALLSWIDKHNVKLSGISRNILQKCLYEQN